MTSTPIRPTNEEGPEGLYAVGDDEVECGEVMETEDQGQEKVELEPPKDEDGEVRKPKIPVDPGQPTQREIDEHEAAGHNPFRAWCKFCVEGKAVSSPHYKRKAEEDLKETGMITVSLDYCWVNENVEDNDEEAARRGTPILIMYVNIIDAMFALSVKRKGAEPWVIEFITRKLAKQTGGPPLAPAGNLYPHGMRMRATHAYVYQRVGHSRLYLYIYMGYVF